MAVEPKYELRQLSPDGEIINRTIHDTWDEAAAEAVLQGLGVWLNKNEFKLRQWVEIKAVRNNDPSLAS